MIHISPVDFTQNKIRFGFDHCVFIDLPLFRLNGAALYSDDWMEENGKICTRKRIDGTTRRPGVYKIIYTCRVCCTINTCAVYIYIVRLLL